MIFDIVIPVGPNDKDKIHKQLMYTKKNIIGYRKIFIITNVDLSYVPDGVIIIPERFYPFGKQDVEQYHGVNKRNGWYLQQLLKMYAWKVCPDITRHYLVIDCDTFFLRPTVFWEGNIPLYNWGIQYYKEYFDHISRLHPTIKRVNSKKSGVVHHMMFDSFYLEQLFKLVEYDGLDFWQVFLKKVNKKYYEESGASEYELYFNFMLIYHPTKIKLRKLSYCDTKDFDSSKYDYVSDHWDLVCTFDTIDDLLRVCCSYFGEHIHDQLKEHITIEQEYALENYPKRPYTYVITEAETWDEVFQIYCFIEKHDNQWIVNKNV